MTSDPCSFRTEAKAPPPGISRWLAALACAALLGGLGEGARADERSPAPSPLSSRLGDAVPDDSALDGDEIYRRVQRNRFRSLVEETRLVSGNRGERDQETRLRVSWKNTRDEQDQPTRGVWSKTLIEYTHPFDIRFTNYLVVDNADRPNDQFVYLPSRRRIRRVNLRGESILGTDFTFEDVVPREFEHSTHRRLADALVRGVACFVVEITPKPGEDSEYSRFLVHVEKEHYVVIETHYFDTADVEVKRMEANVDSIREFDGVWLPMRGKMTQLQQESWTEITIESLTPNAKLPDSTFEMRKLEGH